mmetsp:Transcript_70413/g.165765  ORF Transcript_70413/g.165765 Transcript_70413/m.165765 type:complete len:149 (+) Transcript_70413:564-1010(+)
MEASSVEVREGLSEVEAAAMDVGAVFIDGDHHLDFVINDWELAMLLLGDKGGVIVLDDMRLKDVRKALHLFFWLLAVFFCRLVHSWCQGLWRSCYKSSRHHEVHHSHRHRVCGPRAEVMGRPHTVIINSRIDATTRNSRDTIAAMVLP